MDASLQSPRDSTPTGSSSPPSPDGAEPHEYEPGLPLSTEAYRREILRRKREDAEQNSEAIRARCQSLHGFVMEAWRVLEPRATFVDNWHIHLICDHLEAVTRGEITRLLINVWPGSMKSLLVSVLWPAWEWGPKAMRSLRHLSTAFADKPVKRDTRKTRDLIKSEWYQTLWPEVQLVREAEMSFANADTGTREGVAFGSLTSQRADRLTIDDPHSTEMAESETERGNTTRKFREGAVNRLNDQERSAIVIMMQRLHMDDISGVVEQYDLGYVHVVLPMEFEVARRCETPWGRDPRTDEGEIADPVRFPPSAIADLKKSGDYFWASQYQQRPAPREGGMFKVEKLTGEDNALIVPCVPEGCKGRVRGWDIAGSTRKKSPYTVGAKLALVGELVYIEHVERARAEIDKAEALIVTTAHEDTLAVKQSIPQDPGQAGKSQKLHLANRLAGLDFIFTPETGAKEDRAIPFASMVNAGSVRLVRGPWNSALIEELRNFPAGSYKDQVDALSRAFAEISKLMAQPKRTVGMPMFVGAEDA